VEIGRISLPTGSTGFTVGITEGVIGFASGFTVGITGGVIGFTFLCINGTIGGVIGFAVLVELAGASFQQFNTFLLTVVYISSKKALLFLQQSIKHY
jgi:hypothetical protein